MKTYCITYGDSNYAVQREIFRNAAIASGFFDYVKLYTDADIDSTFYNQIYDPIKSERGGGYWVWKPYIIKKALEGLEHEDILFYCDAGCHNNTAGSKRFNEYITMLSNPNTFTLDFQLRYSEYQYTKQEAFDWFASGAEIINTKQLHATVIILKKCQHSCFLINSWYDAACSNPFLFTDEKIKTQHPLFIDHRHDQSIYSIIRKTYGANIIADDTDYYDFETGAKFPFWAMRYKDPK
jgi:hypothetical protein